MAESVPETRESDSPPDSPSETTSLLDDHDLSNKKHLSRQETFNSRSEPFSYISRYFTPSHEQSIVNDADERQPLLDPDDPAVTPLNLKQVRIMRLVLCFMLFLNLILTIVIFINCFVSVPYMKLRSSGFLELE